MNEKQKPTKKAKIIRPHSGDGAAHFWKKPFGKCDPKKAMPQDCFDVEGIDAALEEIHD